MTSERAALLEQFRKLHGVNTMPEGCDLEIFAPRRSHRTRFVKHDADPLGIAPAQRSEIVTMLTSMGREWCTAAVTA